MGRRVIGARFREGNWIRAVGQWAALGVFVATATGCDVSKNVWRTDEERINAAYPMSPAVGEAKAKLDETPTQDEANRGGPSAELSTRTKLRAINCANGYTPSLLSSVATIRKEVGNEKCFAKFDEQLVQWLRSKRLQRLLVAPALKPIPAEVPGVIAASQPIGQVRFAAAAGVALVTANHLVEIIDLGSGESIYTDKEVPFYPTYVEISPNGRLFATGSMSATQPGVVVRDSATGEAVAEFLEYQRLVWLDSMTAAVTKRNAQGLELHDFVSGETTAVKGLSGIPTRLLAVPGEPDTFVAVSYGSLLKFRLQRKKDGLQVALLEQAAGPTLSEAGGETAVGTQMYLHASGDLWSTDLVSLKTTRTSFKPAMVLSATPLPDPAEVLLALSTGALSAANAKLVVYSTKDGHFEPVEDERVAGPGFGLTGYTGARTVYVPTLKRVAVISGPTLKPIADLGRGFRYSSEALVQQLQEEDRARLEKAAIEQAQRLGYQTAGSLNGVPVMKGPIAELARNAQIEAIGVYESTGGSHGPGRPHVAGPVTVILRRSSKPIVLVLSSYEPVNWKIVNTGSELKAVLLASAGDSTIEGAGSARVVQIGSMYAYERGGQGFGGLQQEVIRWSGKSIDVFQGKYSGTTFAVGGL